MPILIFFVDGSNAKFYMFIVTLSATGTLTLTVAEVVAVTCVVGTETFAFELSDTGGVFACVVLVGVWYELLLEKIK